jgi:type IV pilus assembly protein PilQ
LALESLLSARGSAVSDSRTNTLIINDTQQNIDKIRRMIDLLDVAVKQVMVEARIVTASTDFSRELGIKWSAKKLAIAQYGVGISSQVLIWVWI